MHPRNAGEGLLKPRTLEAIERMKIRLQQRRCPFCNTRLKKRRVFAEGRSGWVLTVIKHWMTRTTLVECGKCKQTFKLNFGPKTKAVAENEAASNLIKELETEQVEQSEKMKDLKSGKPKAWRRIPYDQPRNAGDTPSEGSVPKSDAKDGGQS